MEKSRLYDYTDYDLIARIGHILELKTNPCLPAPVPTEGGAGRCVIIFGICVMMRASRDFQEPSLFRADEKNDHGPSKEEDEKDEKLFYQFGVHMISF